MSFSKRFFAFALASFLGFTGSAWAQNSCNKELENNLLAAANAAGVNVHADSIVTSAAAGATVASTTIVGFESVPATRLPEGVDAGFVYVDAPGSPIPTGFYTLRASAPRASLRVGQVAGTVDFVDADGQVAASLPASIEVSSLEVPNPLPFPRTLIRQSVQTTEAQELIIIIVIHCPNGETIIIVINW